MSLKDIKRRLQKDGIPIYRERKVILREAKRMIDQGPSHFRRADRSTKSAVIIVLVFVLAVFGFLITS